METRDFEKVDEAKRDILALYRNDIRKYADNQEAKVADVFEEIPGQLQKHEKKFLSPRCGVKRVCATIRRLSSG